MKIEVVLTEAEIVQELAEAVEARDLPEKFFYWSPLAVRAWLARAADPAYHGLRRCWKKLAAEARLSSLESRIHPHFLFNTLNSISSLIVTNPARAEQMVGRLAALLRASLRSLS